MWFELHCHSTCSDGTDAPAEVARRAAARGVGWFALTDHDTTAGAEAARAALAPDTRVLRATELTCDHDGTTVHVLVYDRGGDWAAIEAVLAAMRAARRARLEQMGARLHALGVALELAPLLAAAETRAVGRPDLARMLVASGHATTPRDAFARFLFDGGPVDVPHARAPAMADALAAGRDAGAAMALAHPHFYDGRPGSSAPPLGPILARTYKDRGLTGLEAFYGLYDSAARRRWIGLADELGLVCTGGSDWHGAGEIMNSVSGVPIGVDLPARRADALAAWLS